MLFRSITFATASCTVLHGQPESVDDVNYKQSSQPGSWRKASHDPLYSFQVLDGPHVGDGRDFLWVGLDAPLGNDEPQEHASGDFEDTLLRIEFYASRLETLECRFKVREEVGGSLRPDNMENRSEREV